MINDQELLTTHALSGKSESSLPFDSVRHRVGLQNLLNAFKEPQPLVILNGDSPTDRYQLISSFLDGLKDDVTVVRVDKTCSNAREGMRHAVQATGFAPQNMSLIELEIMFVKFLSLQRFHGRRTVFLIEETPDNDHWVSDKVRDLVELERAGNFGLMVILSRQSAALDEADIPVLRMDEADIPVLRMEESSAMVGVTRKMRKLFPRAPSTPRPDTVNESELAELNLSMDSDATVPLQQFAAHDGQKVHDLTLEQPRIMIGRAEDNDLCINAKNVSRHHAILVRYGAAAIVMDLNSTNGTYVNSRRIKDQIVVHHDIIDIGAHRIRFIAAST